MYSHYRSKHSLDPIIWYDDDDDGDATNPFLLKSNLLDMIYVFRNF